MIAYGNNVRHNPLMTRKQVLRCFRMARASVGPEAGLWGFSEIQGFGRNYDRLLREVFDPGRYSVVGRRTELSLVIDRVHFELHDRKVIRLTHGSRRIPQPDRWLVMGLVSAKAHPELPPFWRAVTHRTNGGYNGPRHKPFKRARRELVDVQIERTAHEFSLLEESILWDGDVNQADAPRTLPGEVVVLEHGIDTMRKLERPGGVRFHLDGARVLRGPSDHPALRARIRLERPL